MRIHSTRGLGQLWLGSAAVFAACVVVTRLLGRNDDVRMPALWIGYVGLAAIGVALGLTWGWVGRGGPKSPIARALMRLGLVGAMLLWGLAMVFPFL